MRRWLLDLLIAVLLCIMIFAALAACATPTPYLCVQARLETGAPALYCQPLPRETDQ